MCCATSLQALTPKVTLLSVKGNLLKVLQQVVARSRSLNSLSTLRKPFSNIIQSFKLLAMLKMLKWMLDPVFNAFKIVSELERLL